MTKIYVVEITTYFFGGTDLERFYRSTLQKAKDVVSKETGWSPAWKERSYKDGLKMWRASRELYGEYSVAIYEEEFE